MRIKGQHSLLYKLAVLFTAFTLIAVAISAVATYRNQTRIYMLQQEQSLQNISEYLSLLLRTDQADFKAYQAYFMSRHDEMDIPVGFDEQDVAAAREDYEALFYAEYQGKVLGRDISFSELSPEVQKAYALYAHEYFLQMFEKATEIFGLAYTYYIVPTGEERHICYVLDAVREGREEDSDHINLGIELYQPVEEHGKMWEAWDTGMVPSGYDSYDNDYGKTYAWYVPLYVDGEKLGLIGTEVAIADYNRAIALNTKRQLGVTTVLLLLLEAIAIWGINHFYISRIRHLIDGVERYAQDKNPEIASEIEDNTARFDEIGILGSRTAEMILEMNNYMNNLVRASEELIVTRTQVDVMSKVARRDALTGVRNGTAYHEALRRLDWQIRAGEVEFGIAVVDLNNLKRINDTYGHETGNIAIKRCCKFTCDVFCHSPVFRIGGDEFAIVLENDDYRNVKDLVAKFNRGLEELKKDKSLEIWERFSAAIGYALYDPSRDESVENVFRRADKAMYEKKKKMHEGRT